jgi:hypothetical protein
MAVTACQILACNSLGYLSFFCDRDGVRVNATLDTILPPNSHYCHLDILLSKHSLPTSRLELRDADAGVIRLQATPGR